MTIGLLDPALFLARDQKLLVAELDLVVLTCRQFKIRLIPLQEYWPDLWKDLGRSLETTLPPPARQALQELRKLGANYPDSSVPPLAPGLGKVWKNGFEQLFASIPSRGPASQKDWPQAMAAAALRAVASGEDVVLLTCRDQRNRVIHQTQDCRLDENSRWLLHVQSRTLGRKIILCIHHPRNFTERWTARFDWRLPCSADARFPFCVPDDWWKKSTTAIATIKSKPCWRDKHGNGWARPNINEGAGYHWDVFIANPNHRQAIGVDQINVVQYASTDRGKKAGWIHHAPDEKKGKIDENIRGWRC